MRTNSTFGKREIMLVAHFLRKRFRQDMGDSLKDAWGWLKTGNSNFSSFLGLVIKAKRMDSLKDFDLGGFISQMQDNTHATVQFEGWIWDESYNKLFA